MSQIQGAFTLQTLNADDSALIDFWAPLYRYDLEDLYDDNIHEKPFTEKAINALFVWKNGGERSKKKRASVEQNYISKKDSKKVAQFGASFGFTAVTSSFRFTINTFIER